jgi:predicted porin
MPIYALDTELYGSVRVQLEYVEPDNEAGNFDDYVDLRDAYSRVGLKVHHTFSQQWSALFQLEAPLDVANVDIHGPWDQDEDLRIFKLNLSTPAGDFSYGRGWMPYYNNIAYPVDYFSSYYSGFATFTTFRLDDTLSYT